MQISLSPILGWGFRFCFLAGLALPVWAQEAPLSAVGTLPQAASPSAVPSRADKPVMDATAERQIIERIEQEQARLRKVQADLEQLEEERARKQWELERQREKERQLRGELSRINSRNRVGGRAGIGWHERNLEIYQYNLEVKFPRQRSQLLARQEALEAELGSLDPLISGLFRGALAWPCERTSPAARQAVLTQAILQTTLPALLEKKALCREELRDVQAQLEEIDQLVDHDEYLMRGNIRGMEEKEKRRAPLAKDLEETARRKRLAEEEIEQSQKKIETLQSLIAQIQEALPLLQQGIDYKSFAEQKGELFWPIVGSVLHGYGARKHPEFDLVIDNPGIDILAEPGQEIQAAAAGWVVYTGTLPGYGSLVMLHHGSGYFSFYTPAVAVEGAVAGGGTETRVAQGQVIARLAGSPTAEQNVLHFEIRRGEVALNPLDWLRRTASKSAGGPSGLSKE